MCEKQTDIELCSQLYFPYLDHSFLSVQKIHNLGVYVIVLNIIFDIWFYLNTKECKNDA